MVTNNHQNTTVSIKQLISFAIDDANKLPQVDIMKQIGMMLRDRPATVQDFVTHVKVQLLENKSAVSLYLLLELVEYTTCQCGADLHKEYNSKSFLKDYNVLLKRGGLEPLVQEKALYVLQFWVRYFKNEGERYKNFKWYYAGVKKMGVSFPVDSPSPYESRRIKVSPVVVETQSRSPSPVKQTEMEFNKKQIKLLADLDVVVDNIRLANEMIDNKEGECLSDTMTHIDAMESKMESLPAKLNKPNEELIYQYSISIYNDLSNTKIRHEALRAKRKVPAFTTNTYNIQDAIRKFVLTPKHMEKPKARKEQLTIDLPVERTEPNSYAVDFNNDIIDINKLSNYFASNSVKNTPSNNNGNWMRFGFQNEQRTISTIATPMHTTKMHADDLLDITNAQPVTQKNTQKVVRFGVANDSNFIDLDFTRMDNCDNTTDSVGRVENVYQPSDDVKYEKLENKSMPKKTEYDPFADIQDFELLHMK